MTPCPHPPRRYYSGYAYNLVTNANDWLWIGCCDCGAILKGGNEEFEAYLRQHGYAPPGEE